MDALRHRARQLRNAPTDAEHRLWQRLRGGRLAGVKFRRQMPIAGYIADFGAPAMRLVIELDGGQHAQQLQADAARTRALNAAGYRVLRYWNDDVLQRTDAVLKDILRALGLDG
ncbi:endonuclease domain-containing protein [Pseudoxanthomonas winnipegensis]|jgi:very-short-patch-repair endonuclease|uniref:Endonuclease domain-containing protein n=1 Tax=Pseudoxanthomonas winnipegensis TaxID=2480810 RepID=A0ABY1WIB3_9GAMM|nr:DUF559 domain-containing protein [Pseudoxanthomonas winnipegensis]TAA10151.1 endonuclease domain-containing protein [Pseudoxanthomonas winnipegensis]TAA22468.1 endonuclease domain-containing protein [Pseudoxanthomonas winnipegensis]TAH70060.1 endonuclease domain-containing protein [Pseudoxanthomonas winnipegensis]